jgi:hypothetical protein
VCGPTAEPVPLCGTTTITGSSSGYVLVSAPDEGVVLDDANIHIDGQGDFVGIVLTSDPPYLTAPECGKDPNGNEIRLCPNDEIHIRGLVSREFGGRGRFASISMGSCFSKCTIAGAYRLYLLTDGSPVSVTLSFPDLSGQVGLSPVHGVKYDTREPDPSLEPSTTPFDGAGFTGTFPTPGMEFGVVMADAIESADTEAGLCYYLQDPGDPRLAYQPGCPSIADGIISEGGRFLPLDSSTTLIGFAYPFDVGAAGVGGFAASAGVGTESYVIVSQLAFDHA